MKYNDYLFYNESLITYNDSRDSILDFSNLTTTSLLSVESIPSANISLIKVDDISQGVFSLENLDNITFGQMDLDVLEVNDSCTTSTLVNEQASAEFKVVRISETGILNEFEFW